MHFLVFRIHLGQNGHNGWHSTFWINNYIWTSPDISELLWSIGAVAERSSNLIDYVWLPHWWVYFALLYPGLVLTRLPLVTQKCVGVLGHHWFRQWLVACSAPSQYRNQCWLIVNWTAGNKIRWNMNRIVFIFIQEDLFENVACQIGGHIVQGGMSKWGCLISKRDGGIILVILLLCSVFTCYLCDSPLYFQHFIKKDIVRVV